MKTLSKKNDSTLNKYAMDAFGANGIDYTPKFFTREDIVTVFEKIDAFRNFFQQNRQPGLDDVLMRIAGLTGKRSFLVFKDNKYITVPTEKIAYFYVKYESSIIMCFDRIEYSVNRSLEHIHDLLSDKQFFRLNRQYLINFNAVKEVEHYFARKLLVNLSVPVPGKLLVPKEKAGSFLHWLEDR